MSGSRLVAGLFGLVLIGLALSDAAKLHIWTNTPAPVAYLSSAVLSVGRLIIVLVHNRWTGGQGPEESIPGWRLAAMFLWRYRSSNPDSRSPSINGAQLMGHEVLREHY